MSRRDPRDDTAQVRRDDALLDALAATDAVSWETRAGADDPALALLGALRADVADCSDAPGFTWTAAADTTSLPVVNLEMARRRRDRRLGKRTLVSGVVALSVL